MRDLILTAFVFGTIPFILRNPFYGLLMWVWLGIMNPHRLTWGFAYSLPFAQIVALSTFLGIFFNFGKTQRPPMDRVAVFLVLLLVWISINPIFAFHPENELEPWLRAFKVQFMCLLALILVCNRDQLHKLILVLAVSVGFYGVKGGMFTIITGGGSRVWGPPGSFIADNNQLALAIVMAIPLLNYLRIHTEKIWVQRAYVAAMMFSAIAALGTQSRGALLALTGMGFFLFLKSRKKGLIALLVLFSIPVVIYFMPESWVERMSTIRTYDQDASAMGRINAWMMAWNLAIDRFPLGGGFSTWTPEVYLRYAPDPTNVLVAHSIYFHMLGDHGFLGLILFLLVFWMAWLNGSWVINLTKNKEGMEWAYDLANMCQVSLVGYFVGGAFLSLTYFDLPYYIIVVLILLRYQVDWLIKRQVNVRVC